MSKDLKAGEVEEIFKDLFTDASFNGIVGLTEDSLTKAVTYRKDEVQEVYNPPSHHHHR